MHACNACTVRAPCVHRACTVRAPCVCHMHAMRTPESQEAELRLVPVQRPHVDPHAPRREQIPSDAHRRRRVGQGIYEVARHQHIPRLRRAGAVALGAVKLLKGAHLQREVAPTVRRGGRDVGRARGSKAGRPPQRSRLAAYAREEAQGVARHGAREQRVRRDQHARGGVVGLDAVAAPRHLCVRGMPLWNALWNATTECPMEYI